ncbi:hypothetical protein PDESU_00225 [Pontiella desulfatans]|uniref:Uncharacterized protein n=1 Tax=Pontiella desulfatans TaxID=2750659 RepID=A0A6C2TVK5_PONDE|nr:TonB-dependent receptor [Pontiella desulfatans]VGO11680.1 hypothetical protein PDESU_00225 [Pontiella desulfatans]
MKYSLKTLLVVCCSFIVVQAYSQMGGIRGSVMDKDFEVPLTGVKVRISETGQEAETGDAGSYYLEQVPPGAYTLLFSKSGYTRFTKPEVVVMGGQLAEVEAALEGEYEEMDELVVRDIQLGGASEIGLLNLRMESSALMDSVGADLISQAGASDAAGALKLVSGTTVQDGKYAVVRGLPDRYVVSLLNGVRLPTADPDKRAVQLDQYPSSLIESVRVLKSFTPDQQGDASGGAVDVVLRGIPEKRVLKFSVGTKYNENYGGDEFLSYDTSENDYWGQREFEPAEDLAETIDGEQRNDRPIAQYPTTSYGVSQTDQPENYSWGIELGDRYDLDLFGEEVSVGGLAAFNYEQSATYYEGISDKYTLAPDNTYTNTGTISKEVDSEHVALTDMWDIKKGTYEINWSGAVGIGLEHELLKLNYLHVFTHNTEDTAIQSLDFRGRETYNPEYVDFVEPESSSDYLQDFSRYYAPYRRSESIVYAERDTESDQFGGELTLPVPDLNLGIIKFKRPVLDIKLSDSSSSLWKQKEMLDYFWYPGKATTEIAEGWEWDAGIPTDDILPGALENFVSGAAWLNPFTNSLGEVKAPPAVTEKWITDYAAFKSYIERHPELGLVFPQYAWYNGNVNVDGSNPQEITGVESNGTYVADSGIQLGNYQVIWQEVVEDSDQVAFNYKWDFENWTANKGFFKAGIFQDRVDRKYFQQTLSNISPDPSVSFDTGFKGTWDESLADLFAADSNTAVYSSFADIQYDGEQDLDAHYFMLDFPVFDFLTVRGGVRHEEFALKTFLEPDDYQYARTIKSGGGLGYLTSNETGYVEDADYSRVDNLPSIGFDLTPVEPITFRFNWAQTVAKQQFKEVVPIIQREYAGADAFYGNPDLVASPVDNLDLRLDYTPYPGGLISVSYFTKDITDPIQYYKGYDDYGNGYTFVTNYSSAWVDGYEFEIRQDLGRFFSPMEGMSVGANYTYITGEVDLGNGETSDVMEMPEYLYNLFCTYGIDFMDTKIGLFYTHQGDTLKTVKNDEGTPSPAIYALDYGALNFTISTKLTDHLKLSFKAKNLTDPDIQTVYRVDGLGDALHTSYTKGREYSVGVTASW